LSIAGISEPAGLSSTPFVSLSEAVQLLAFGEVKPAAELDMSFHAELKDPDTISPDIWRERITALEKHGSKLNAEGKRRLQRLRNKLADFQQEVAKVNAAAARLFEAHVAGDISLTGFEKPARQDTSTKRQAIPPEYFADPRVANWLNSSVQPALDGEISQRTFERLRNDPLWLDVTVRRDALVALWRKLQPPNAGSASTGQQSALPAWVSLPMALAWVRYRTVDAALELSTYDALKAESFYGKRTRVGSDTDLQAALSEGRLFARGALAGGPMQKIPSEEWTRLSVRPHLGDPVSPYSSVVIAKDDLLRRFPSSGGQDVETRRKTITDARLKAWLIALGHEGESLAQTKLLRLALDAHPGIHIPRAQIRRITPNRKRGKRRSAAN